MYVNVVVKIMDLSEEGLKILQLQGQRCQQPWYLKIPNLLPKALKDIQARGEEFKSDLIHVSIW